jgi:hypothetical protein
MTTIFRKTAEGQSEIETRSHHLVLDLAVQVIQNPRGSGAALEYTRRFLLAPA